MRLVRLTVFVPLLFLLVSCAPEEKLLSPEVPPTPVLTSPSIWGVVNLPYLKALEASDPASGISLVLREGDVVEVVSKVGLGDGLDYWLEIRTGEGGGWVPETSMDVYDSRAQAITAASSGKDSP